ncbi:unannotated protein [freshwater metagenome]|uniref:Unannotated protein n=1 Tax=freshwater metagenome TaxID=449393 RepID=A0A6J7IZX4_9ZZZZ
MSSVILEWSSAQEFRSGIPYGAEFLSAYNLCRVLGNSQGDEVGITELISDVVNALQKDFNKLF